MFLSKYKTIVFDCDGVILNSNNLKTLAFYNVALPYGEEKVRELVAYHIQHGGISRKNKFEFFLRGILGQKVTRTILNQLLDAYAREVQEGLLHCEVAAGLDALREATPHMRWMVVSGGNQSELRDVFAQRKIDHLFDAGIYGSPENKENILAREIETGNIVRPSLFVGDSRYDHEVAMRAELDFIFVAGWTEFDDWATYCERHNIHWIRKVANLLSSK